MPCWPACRQKSVSTPDARPNGVAAGAASRAVEQAIQPVIIELNSKPAADKARTSAKDNGVGDDDAPFMSHGSDI